MITLNSISKKFRIENIHKGGLDFFSSYFSKKKPESFWALENISFRLNKGDVLGVVGKNGSGKSTLLKIIAGILKETSGDLSVEGKSVYLSGFSSGLNMNLSMRDNIYLLGFLNSLSKAEISNRIGIIVEFSELENFLDTPLYKFSTGMIARFSFSVNLFTLPDSPDILLLDETFAGGIDESFKEKSLEKINAYIKSAKVVVIVSHNTKYLLKYCTKVLWLKNGKTQMLDDTDKVITSYHEFVK